MRKCQLCKFGKRDLVENVATSLPKDCKFSKKSKIPTPSIPGIPKTQAAFPTNRIFKTIISSQNPSSSQITKEMKCVWLHIPGVVTWRRRKARRGACTIKYRKCSFRIVGKLCARARVRARVYVCLCVCVRVCMCCYDIRSPNLWLRRGVKSPCDRLTPDMTHGTYAYEWGRCNAGEPHL